jgi:hypothetical protein
LLDLRAALCGYPGGAAGAAYWDGGIDYHPHLNQRLI